MCVKSQMVPLQQSTHFFELASLIFIIKIVSQKKKLLKSLAQTPKALYRSVVQPGLGRSPASR